MGTNIMLAILWLLLLCQSVFSQDIFLSFDVEPVDGRDSVITVLGTLARHNATATFFVTGEYAEQFPDLVTLMHDSGHEVACHSYSHPYMTALTKVEKEEQVRRCAILERITGVRPIGFRAPYNMVDYETTEILAESGYKYDASRFEVYQHGRSKVEQLKIDVMVFPFSDVVSMHYLHVPEKMYYWLIMHAGDRVSASFHPHILVGSIGEFDKMLEKMSERNVTFIRHADA